MDRTSVDWHGYWPAAPTPFGIDGEIDDRTIRELMNHYVRVGVHGVLVNGSSGEWWAQSKDERIHVADVAIEEISGRIPVLVGCTAFTAKEVIELAKEAGSSGAQGILATPPPYASPTQREILAYYSEIDAAIDLPLTVYNWPRGTAVEISLETAREISDLDHVVAFKNSTSNWDSVVNYIEALSDQVRIFGSLINRRGLAIMRGLGGDGYIDGGGVGAVYAVPFFDAMWNGRFDEAQIMADQYWKLTSGWINSDFSGKFGSPSSQLKAAMKMLGQPGGHVRPPLIPTTGRDSLEGIATLLLDCGLIDEGTLHVAISSSASN